MKKTRKTINLHELEERLNKQREEKNRWYKEQEEKYKETLEKLFNLTYFVEENKRMLKRMLIQGEIEEATLLETIEQVEKNFQ